MVCAALFNHPSMRSSQENFFRLKLQAYPSSLVTTAASRASKPFRSERAPLSWNESRTTSNHSGFPDSELRVPSSEFEDEVTSYASHHQDGAHFAMPQVTQKDKAPEPTPRLTLCLAMDLK